MNYEEKYKNALRWIESIYPTLQHEQQMEAGGVFPEIAESEDERMRRELMDFVVGNTICKDGRREKYLAWLEKQGKSFTKKDVDDAWLQGILCDAKRELEKQEEQMMAKGERKNVALSIINYLDDNRVAGCMDLSSMECEDIEDACVNSKWTKLYNYMKKKLETPDLLNYNPYEATVKSIIAMTERYADGNDLRDFYDNVKVKCKEAIDYDKTWLEKTSKQESTDELEQEFKVGDWIASARGTAHIIDIEVADSKFLLEYTDGDQESLSIEYVNSAYTKWTIKRAWDGDVLISACNHPFIYNGNNNSSYVGSYCGIETTGGFKISTEECYWTENINIHPANKEQQDYLFKKMREAGYMWDGHTKKVICK